MDFQAAVQECIILLNQIEHEEKRKIELNLKLGAVVKDVIESARYGEHAVEKFASNLTREMGKTVYPQRLYEAYNVYLTVGSIEKVREIEKKLQREVTWNWLVKHATCKPENEGNRVLRQEKIEKKFQKMERAVQAIEELDEININSMDETEKEAMKGVAIASLETVTPVISGLITKIESSSEKEIRSEHDAESEKLLHVIGYDEITHEHSDSLEVHSFGSGIDRAIVVSHRTHRDIHRGKISSKEMIRLIIERNLRFARLYIDVLLRQAGTNNIKYEKEDIYLR